MKKSFLLFTAIITFAFTACRKDPEKNWITQALNISSNQIKQKAVQVVQTDALFPGSLWYAYEITGDEELKVQAVRYTNLLHPERDVKDTHNLGCIISSYVHALRLSPNDSIEAAMVQATDMLCTRLDSKRDCIHCGNIPDLLFSASKLTGNKKYYDVAVKHAQATLGHHSPLDEPYANSSPQTRKQAWAVYNYTDCYRETQNIVFLQEAMEVANTIMDQVQNTEHPLNTNAPDSQISPHDATTASITVSALLELSTVAPDGLKYFQYAEAMLKDLSQPDYLDANYYYLEALKRYLDMRK